MSVNKYIEALESPTREIVVELRRVITEHSDELKEEIKWNVPTYSKNKNICSIMAHKKHVNFQIMHGAQLDDEGELEGTGVNMRHMKFSTVNDVDVAKVEFFLQRAMELDDGLL